MEVPVTAGMQDERRPLDIRIEERLGADFDLSGGGEYVTFDDIEGTVFVEFDVNRGEILDRVERGEDPTAMDRLNAFLEDWGFGGIDPNTVELEYGSVLFTGAEPIQDAPRSLELRTELDRQTIQETSPSDLNRELRREIEYRTTYQDLKDSFEQYLEREGIQPEEYEFGSPVHIQARADPDPGEDDETDLIGTEFTITITNNRRVSTLASELRVSMHPAIGREIELSHYDTDGSYDPDNRELVIDVPPLAPSAGDEDDTAELSFLVPPSAGRDLEVLDGTAEIQSEYTVSEFMPHAVLDPGGNLLYRRNDDATAERIDIRTKSTIEGRFETDVQYITVGEGASVTKELTIAGVTPPSAKDEINDVLVQRGIDANEDNLAENRETREGTQVTTFNGGFTNGSVIVEDTRVIINITIEGHRRTGEVEAERAESTDLPAQRRSVTTDYGRTEVVIDGRGSDLEKVDEYVSDLRDDIQRALESIATEV